MYETSTATAAPETGAAKARYEPGRERPHPGATMIGGTAGRSMRACIGSTNEIRAEAQKISEGLIKLSS